MMKLWFAIKNFFSKRQNRLYAVLSLVISIALANITQQFMLRFLLTNPARIMIIPILVVALWFPATYLLIMKLAEEFRTGERARLAVLVVISSIVAVIFYLVSPIKITGNLVILERAPIFLYRVSRLINIISFLLSFTFLLTNALASIQRKLGNQRVWAVTANLFFILVLLLGLFIFKDYGISSDEPNERTNGLVSAKYVADHITEKLPDIDPYLPKLSTYRYQYYGVAYQLPLALIEQNTMLKDEAIWQFRHLANFLFFYLGVLAFFHLAADVFQDGRYGLAAAVFLVISPRIFSHAFFNPKDSVFLSAFAIALYFCYLLWKKPSVWLALAAGITCAFAANVRIIAISLILITLGIFLIDWIIKRDGTRWRITVVLLLSFIIFLFLFWPASWANPLEYLKNAIFLFADYVYWDFRIMYLGRFIRGANAPWHYLPVWMGITIPLAYILLFLIGTVQIIWKALNLKLATFKDHSTRTMLIFLCIFLIPPILAVGLNSTLYNGWRHFQFIYPSFLLIGLQGFQVLLAQFANPSRNLWKKIVLSTILVFISINVLFVAFWMFQNHPFQAVYFNQIGKIIGRERFERDYWRVSMKQGLEYILERDGREVVHICTEDQFDDSTFLMILPPQDRNRIRIISVNPSESTCDYAIDTFRYPEMFRCVSHLHTFQADGLPTLSIDQCQ